MQILAYAAALSVGHAEDFALECLSPFDFALRAAFIWANSVVRSATLCSSSA